MAQRLLKIASPMLYGADVRQAQERLHAFGFDAGRADGIYGPQTLAAVKAFQRRYGLTADGIVGPLTWAALLAPTPTQTQAREDAQSGALKEDFLRFLKAQLGHIYVWGGQGETVADPAWIYRKETTAYNGARAAALYKKRREEGLDPIRAYDCSGLIMRFLEDRSLVSYDHSSRALFAKCSLLSRAQLQPCDLVFRHNGVQIYHVGVYAGDGQVIEAKGRDDGVVMRDIDASGTRYWNRYGRLSYLEG
ncbi:MAG: peptidoglycan-binding protein [Clostridia bacterium]|nr:peptidoglycan-binding protein [Clostridia bacterium]